MSERSAGSILARHSLVYAMVPLVRYGTSIAMTKAYTGWLLTARYGVKEIVDLWMILAQQLLGQNLLSGMVRIYFERTDERSRAQVVSSATLILSALAWAGCGLAWTGTRWLTPLLLGSGAGEVAALELEQALRIVLLLVPFQLSTLAGFTYLQIHKRSGLYAGVQLAKLGLEVGLHVWFMGVQAMGLRGFLLGLLIGEAMTTLLLTGSVLARVGWTVRWSAFRPVLTYALPLVPVGVLQLGLHQLDRRLIEWLAPGAGLTLVGVYGLGYKVGYLVNAVLQGPFMQIWTPYVFARPSGPERAQMVARVTSWAVLAIGAASLFAIVFARQALAILSGNPSFGAGASVVPWVACGYVFWALYNAAVVPLLLAKRTLPILGINALALGVNLSLNLLLIPRFSILGAALATCGSFAFLAGLGMLVSARGAEVRFEGRRLVAILSLVCGASAAAAGVERAELGGAFAWTELLARTAVLAAALAALWAFALDAKERRELRSWARARLGGSGAG